MRALSIFRFALFISLALGVVVGGHVYLARRLIVDVALPPLAEGALLGLLIALGLSLFVQPVSERVFNVASWWSRLFGWVASVWMGFAFLGMTTLGLSDLVLWAGADALGDWVGGELALVRVRAVVVLSLVGLTGLYGMRQALRIPAIKRVEVRLKRWPKRLDGFRIVQLSDIHIGPVLDGNYAREVVARANNLAPDAIAITGDLVDGNVQRLGDQVTPFGKLSAPHGVYFVTGNHDHYSHAPSWTAFVAGLGIQVLRNTHVTITRDGAAFDLAGVDDHHGDVFGGGEDVDAALAGRDAQRPVVLLAHDPNTFHAAAQRHVDLQISGHTHGGQIWPFGFLVRLATRFVAGLYRVGESKIYVSRGTGFWGPPMRVGAPPEITELVLRPSESAPSSIN